MQLIGNRDVSPTFFRGALFMNHPTRHCLLPLAIVCITTVTAAGDDGAKLDLGTTWSQLVDVTGNIGGNPPATLLLKDGRVCVTYGYRRKPTGVRARISSDEGRTWSPEIIIRDDGFDGDLGYPRRVLRPDGRVFTVYYFNGPRGEDRAIEGTFWTPPGIGE
jgi:hypothetical protein